MCTRSFYAVLIAIPDFVYYNIMDYNFDKGARYGKQQYILE